MKPILIVVAVCLLAHSAYTAAADKEKNPVEADAALEPENGEAGGSSYDALLGWGKGIGSKLSEKVAEEYESLSLSRMSAQMTEIAGQIEAGASEMTLRRAVDAVSESRAMLAELENSLGADTAEARALIDKTRKTLTVTSALLADPENREDLAEIARNLYAVSKNLKKLSSMVQVSPTRLAWRNLPEVVKYVRHNDFNSIRGDVEALALKLERSADTGLSVSDIENLEGLFAYLSVLVTRLDDNLNESAGQQFGQKFRPGIKRLRETLDETRPLMDDPEQNSTVIIKNMRRMSGDLRELSEITLEFPEYLKLWPTS